MHIIGDITTSGANYCSIEFHGDISQFSVDNRFTITNMGVELGAKNSVFFVDEITNLVKKAEEAGVDVLYHLYPEMPHVHQSLDLSIPEVQTSIQNIGQYVRKHFNLL